MIKSPRPDGRRRERCCFCWTRWPWWCGTGWREGCAWRPPAAELLWRGLHSGLVATLGATRSQILSKCTSMAAGSIPCFKTSAGNTGCPLFLVRSELKTEEGYSADNISRRIYVSRGRCCADIYLHGYMSAQCSHYILLWFSAPEKMSDTEREGEIAKEDDEEGDEELFRKFNNLDPFRGYHFCKCWVFENVFFMVLLLEYINCESDLWFMRSRRDSSTEVRVIFFLDNPLFTG